MLNHSTALYSVFRTIKKVSKMIEISKSLQEFETLEIQI